MSRSADESLAPSAKFGASWHSPSGVYLRPSARIRRRPYGRNRQPCSKAYAGRQNPLLGGLFLRAWSLHHRRPCFDCDCCYAAALQSKLDAFHDARGGNRHIGLGDSPSRDRLRQFFWLGAGLIARIFRPLCRVVSRATTKTTTDNCRRPASEALLACPFSSRAQVLPFRLDLDQCVAGRCAESCFCRAT